MEALRIESLRYSYPDGHQALHGVDLRIGAGERVALLGPNGAGKTTLVLHLNGILPAPRMPGAAGSVTVGEQRIDPADRAGLTEIRRRVGIVFQDPDDQLFLPTVAEDVAFGPANLGLRGDALHARVDEALAAVGMLDHKGRAPHHLSLGQRRRVAVATVLAMRPELLVLDEPSSNLDPQARRELAEILLSLTESGLAERGLTERGLTERGLLAESGLTERGLTESGQASAPVTMLMVTHDLPYALQLCERAVILDEGRIVADGPTGELLADADLLARHRLELPFGFSPHVTTMP
nr:ATP-binding cassette domain-containing protein [Allorhizocola rhizosphaerae]